MAHENEQKSASNAPHEQSGVDDADDLLAELEAEDDSNYRAQRIQELQEAQGAFKPTGSANVGPKAFPTLKNDDETLTFSTEHERAVIHFFHPDFARCITMDRHCEQIAEKHAEYGDADVAFARVDVQNVPFLVEKLTIRVLPCVIGFAKGVVKGRVTGFEGLAWDGGESTYAVTKALEEAFMDWTVVRKRLLLGQNDDEDDSDGAEDRGVARRRGIQDRKQKTEDEDDDWD